ncbi:hypothetical protein GJV09_13015 [Enterobacteriaceae bacterium RIT702]|nr:hypothetical protein [Enterobacteriaceae bacterium RIT702]
MENILNNTKTPIINALRTADNDFFILPGSNSPEYYPVITGTAAPHSLVNIYNGETLIASVMSDNNGQWKHQPDDSLPLYGSVSLRAEQYGVSSTPFTFNAGTEPARAEIKGLYAGPDTEIAPGFTSSTETDASTPMMLITGRPGSTVEVRDNGNLLKTLTLDDDGQLSWTVEPALSAGEHSITLTSNEQTVESAAWKIKVTTSSAATKSAVEGISEPEVQLTMLPYALDDVGRATTITPGSSTDDARPTFIGFTTPNQMVMLYNDKNQIVGSGIANPSGSWLIEPTQDLSDGFNTIFAKAGNQVTAGFELHIQSPASKPVTMSGFAYDNVGTHNYFRSGSTTDDSRPSFGGTAGAGQLVTLYDENGRALGSVITSDSGEWELEISQTLTEGYHSITAKTATQTSGSFELTVQTAIPVSIDRWAYDNVGDSQSFISGGTTDDDRPTFSGQASPGKLVTLYDENNTTLGSVVADSRGYWQLEITTALSVGQHTVTAKSSATDGATFELNVQPISETPVTIEQYAYDNVGRTGYFFNGATTDDSRPLFRGTAGANQLVTLYDQNGRPLGSVTANHGGVWSLEISQELSDGINNIVAKSGSQTSSIFSVNLMTAANTPVAIDPYAHDNVGTSKRFSSGDTTDDSRPTFSGTAGAGQIVTLYDETNRVLGSVKTASSGYWSLEIKQDLAVGYHTVTAKTATQTSNYFALNVEAPTPIVVTIDERFYDNVGMPGYIVSGQGTTDDTRPYFTGTGPARQLVELFDQDGRSLGKTVTNLAGSWRLEITSDLQEGINSVYAKIAGTYSQPLEVIVDTAIPTPLSIDSTALDNVGMARVIVDGKIYPTDDDRPTFTGTAKAGLLVKIVDANGRELGSIVADKNGEWELELTQPLDQGVNKVTAIAGSETSNTFVLLVRSENVTSRSMSVDDGEGRDIDIANLLHNAEPTLFTSAQAEPLAVNALEITEQDMRVTTDSGMSLEIPREDIRNPIEEVIFH